MNIGDRIREARRDRGLSQEAVARRAEVSLSSLRAVEQGGRPHPQYNTLMSIAHAMDMTLSDLVGDAAPLAQAPPDAGDVEERRENEEPSHSQPEPADLRRLEKRLEDETVLGTYVRTKGPLSDTPSFFQQMEAEEKRLYEEGLLGRGSAGLSAEERRSIEAGEERLRAALHAELRRVYASAETTEELLKAQIEIQNRLLARLGGEGLPSEAPDSEVLGQGKGDVAGETA